MTSADRPPLTRHASPWRRLLIGVVLLAALWAVVELTGLRARINPHALREGFSSHLAWGFAGFVALFALGNLIQLPGWIFLASAVLALGPAWGGAATLCAALVGCGVTFVTVRAFGGGALRELPGPLARRLFSRLDAHPVRSVAMLRLLFQTVPAMNYALALSGLRFRDYMLGTLIGLPAPLFIHAAFFDTLAGWMGWQLH